MVQFSKQTAIAQIEAETSLTQSSLESIGTIKSREPQRFYSYALLDPQEEPHACFRYHCLAHGTCQFFLSWWIN